jgi:hypothetical protein
VTVPGLELDEELDEDPDEDGELPEVVDDRGVYVVPDEAGGRFGVEFGV